MLIFADFVPKDALFRREVRFSMDRTRHRTVFSQIKELERGNNCVMIFGSVNQRFVALIFTLGDDKGRDQIITVKLYLYLNVGLLIRVR